MTGVFIQFFISGPITFVFNLPPWPVLPPLPF